MRRLPAILGLVAVLAALGCGGNNSGSTAGVTALSGGPVGIGGSKPPAPPAMPTLKR
jgi:hypothetical protein